MAQKLAPAEKNSTDISAASATFFISDHHQPMVFRLKRIFSYFYPSFTISCVFEFSSYCNGGQFDVKILPDKCIFSSIFDEIKYLYDLKKGDMMASKPNIRMREQTNAFIRSKKL